MFFENQKKKEEVKKHETTPAEAAGVVGLVGIAAVYSYKSTIMRFYFENFEEIYLVGYVVAAIILALIYWQIVKRTKGLEDRVNVLAPLSNPEIGIFVGRTSDGVNLHVSDNVRTGHVQIIAATGKGKTESVNKPWLVRDLARGHSALLIDGKGDPEIVSDIKSAVEYFAKAPKVITFDLGNIPTSCSTNPLGYGSAQQITDRIFAAFEFQDPFYRGVQYDAASSVVGLIHEVDGENGKSSGPEMVPVPIDPKQYKQLLADLAEILYRCFSLANSIETENSRTSNCGASAESEGSNE